MAVTDDTLWTPAPAEIQGMNAPRTMSFLLNASTTAAVGDIIVLDVSEGDHIVDNVDPGASVAGGLADTIVGMAVGAATSAATVDYNRDSDRILVVPAYPGTMFEANLVTDDDTGTPTDEVAAITDNLGIRVPITDCTDPSSRTFPCLSLAAATNDACRPIGYARQYNNGTSAEPGNVVIGTTINPRMTFIFEANATLWGSETDIDT